MITFGIKPIQFAIARIYKRVGDFNYVYIARGDSVETGIEKIIAADLSTLGYGAGWAEPKKDGIPFIWGGLAEPSRHQSQEERLSLRPGCAVRIGSGFLNVHSDIGRWIAPSAVVGKDCLHHSGRRLHSLFRD